MLMMVSETSGGGIGLRSLLKKFPKAKLNWSNGPVTMMAKDHIRKIDKPRKASCLVCDGDLIRYSEGGLVTIKAHLETLRHFRCVTALAKNRLPPGTTIDVRETMSGAPPTYYNDKGALSTTRRSLFKPSVHVLDRAANVEAMLALGLTWQNELTNIFRETPFSLNMDESTSSNTKHICTTFVSFYNPKVENAVEHLGSINVLSCTSEYLYRETWKIFSTKEMPFEKLIGMLADSSSIMCGSVSGLEIKLRTTSGTSSHKY